MFFFSDLCNQAIQSNHDKSGQICLFADLILADIKVDGSPKDVVPCCIL